MTKEIRIKRQNKETGEYFISTEEVEFPLYFMHKSKPLVGRLFCGMCLPDETSVSVAIQKRAGGVNDFEVMSFMSNLFYDGESMLDAGCSAEEFFENLDAAQSAISNGIASIAKYLDPPEVTEITLREELEKNGQGHGTLDEPDNNGD